MPPGLKRHDVVTRKRQFCRGGDRQAQSHAVTADASEHFVGDEVGVEAVDRSRADAREREEQSVELRLSAGLGCVGSQGDAPRSSSIESTNRRAVIGRVHAACTDYARRRLRGSAAISLPLHESATGAYEPARCRLTWRLTATGLLGGSRRATATMGSRSQLQQIANDRHWWRPSAGQNRRRVCKNCKPASPWKVCPTDVDSAPRQSTSEREPRSRGGRRL